MREAENRNLAGFDTTSSNPIGAAAQAAYARSPIAEIPVSNFRVRGGLQFADGPVNDTVLWNPNVDPRNASFGLVNQDRNNPRDIQIGARLKNQQPWHRPRVFQPRPICCETLS